MRVLRVEHLCNNGTAHGPMGWRSDCDAAYDFTPRYGSRGPTPDGDAGLGYIEAHEFCGTLPSQFDAWWSDESRDLFHSHGWIVAEYEVPDEDVRIGEWQVLFPMASAKRVHAHYTAKHFIPVRTPALPSPSEPRRF